MDRSLVDNKDGEVKVGYSGYAFITANIDTFAAVTPSKSKISIMLDGVEIVNFGGSFVENANTITVPIVKGSTISYKCTVNQTLHHSNIKIVLMHKA